ncbi:MAG TPA: hypothetical protein VE198_20540, partial [Actinoallomurus sp.]|nr:hypothetical protein [Actinoallomurus sp.]
ISQLPLVVLIGLWFAAGRGLAVPRAERLLEAELSTSLKDPGGPVPISGTDRGRAVDHQRRSLP